MSQSKCNVTGCSNNATHTIKLTLYAATGDVPAIAYLGLNSCAEHATEEELDNIFYKNEEGKRGIVSAFLSQGKAAPDWKRSTAEWITIAQAREEGSPVH